MGSVFRDLTSLPPCLLPSGCRLSVSCFCVFTDHMAVSPGSLSKEEAEASSSLPTRPPRPGDAVAPDCERKGGLSLLSGG